MNSKIARFQILAVALTIVLSASAGTFAMPPNKRFSPEFQQRLDVLMLNMEKNITADPSFMNLQNGLGAAYIEITFKVDTMGKFYDMHLVTPSESNALNKTALATIRGCRPITPPGSLDVYRLSFRASFTERGVRIHFSTNNDLGPGRFS